MPDAIASALAAAGREETTAGKVAAFLRALEVGEMSAIFLTVPRCGRIELYRSLRELGRAVEQSRRGKLLP